MGRRGRKNVKKRTRKTFSTSESVENTKPRTCKVGESASPSSGDSHSNYPVRRGIYVRMMNATRSKINLQELKIDEVRPKKAVTGGCILVVADQMGKRRPNA